VNKTHVNTCAAHVRMVTRGSGNVCRVSRVHAVRVWGGHSGNCQIWGKKAEKIQAQYVTADGEVKKSLLLLSGWWGLSRHFHYIPEWMAAFAWTAPTLYDGNIVGCASLLPRPPAPAHLVIFSVFPCISFS